MQDVIIVGGSVAGLSAALYLGRTRRKTLIVDAGKPCNRVSHASHGFLTRDGVAPTELVQIGREQLQPYPTVRFQTGQVTRVQAQSDGFGVELADGVIVETRKVLLATGLHDQLPPLANIEQFWGRSVFHCPYCDGWEARDQPLAVHGNGEGALHKSQLLLNLTDDLVICTDGPATFSASDRHFLAAHGVRIIETPVVSLDGEGEQLKTIHFADGSTLARHALFIQPGTSQHSELARRLGCLVDEKGLVKVDEGARTNVTGVYAAGDMTTLARAVVFAAAQGAMAAVTLNRELMEESRRRGE